MEREICINKLNTIINDIDKCKKIEESIYQYTVENAYTKKITKDFADNIFKRIYVNKLINLYNNIDDKSYIKNINLINKINNNEIDLSNIAFLTPQELYPEHWKQYIDRYKANNEFLESNTIGIKTEEHKCRRCKSRNCTYYQLQVRSCDEPMTTFINCLNCGNKWHFN